MFAGTLSTLLGAYAAGAMQQAIAEEMGRSREAVRNYAGLAKINRCAWTIIGTAFQSGTAARDDDAVPGFGTAVPFTEFLLRTIVPLTADQQFDLVQDLAAGRINKNKFSAQAEAYRTRNAAVDWLRSQLGDIDAEIVDEAAAEVAFARPCTKASQSPRPHNTDRANTTRGPCPQTACGEATGRLHGLDRMAPPQAG